jgi:hypothetical protein
VTSYRWESRRGPWPPVVVIITGLIGTGLSGLLGSQALSAPLVWIAGAGSLALVLIGLAMVRDGYVQAVELDDRELRVYEWGGLTRRPRHLVARLGLDDLIRINVLHDEREVVDGLVIESRTGRVSVHAVDGWEQLMAALARGRPSLGEVHSYSIGHDPVVDHVR